MKKKFNKKEETQHKLEIFKKILNGERVNLKDFREYLYCHPTYSEYILKHLFFDFRADYVYTQKIIEPYIVDFYIAPIRLAIEIDGSSHIIKKLYDKKRDEFLLSQGINVLHIDDKDVKDPKCNCVEIIIDVIKYLGILRKKDRFNFQKGIKFEVDPLAFPNEEMLIGFTKEERLPVINVDESFRKASQYWE